MSERVCVGSLTPQRTLCADACVAKLSTSHGGTTLVEAKVRRLARRPTRDSINHNWYPKARGPRL